MRALVKNNGLGVSLSLQVPQSKCNKQGAAHLLVGKERIVANISNEQVEKE